MAVLCAVKDESLDYTAKVNVIGQIVNVVLVVAYLVAMQATVGAYTQVDFWFDPTQPTMDIAPTGVTEPLSGASLPFSVVALIAAACGVAGAFVGKAKKDWKVWGAVCVACVLVSALALRVVFYMACPSTRSSRSRWGACPCGARPSFDGQAVRTDSASRKMSQLRRPPQREAFLAFGDGARLRCGLAQLAAEIFDGGYLVRHRV